MDAWMDASYPNLAAREQLQDLRCPLPQWTVHSDWVVQEQLLWVKSCFSLSNVARPAELHWNMCLGEVRVVSLDQSTTALTFTRSAFICPLSTVKPKKDTVRRTLFSLYTDALDDQTDMFLMLLQGLRENQYIIKVHKHKMINEVP